LPPSLMEEIKVWSSILREVSNAIIWISTTNQIAKENIIKSFKFHGVSASKVLFAERMNSSADHLARHSCADLFLDTFNYNGHSTAIDSLWAGLPVVALLGKSYAARVSASFLNTLKLNNLVAHTTDEYEQIVIQLANNPNKLKALKAKLMQLKYTNPLFDSENYTQDLERLYHGLIEKEKARNNK